MISDLVLQCKTEAGVCFLLKQSSMFFICKRELVDIKTTFSYKLQRGLSQNESLPASLPVEAQVTKHTTVKYLVNVRNFNIHAVLKQDIFERVFFLLFLALFKHFNVAKLSFKPSLKFLHKGLLQEISEKWLLRRERRFFSNLVLHLKHGH